MNITPKISVIVPVYNAEKYLHRCIDSILSQTFTDFELLLIDDGSKDGSGAICDEYAEKDNRVRVFHKENGGVSSARNLGLDNACGEWIAFVDSDDWVEKQFLLSMFECSVHDFVFLNMDDTLSSNALCEQNGMIGKSLIQMIYKNYFFTIWGKLFTKKIIDDHRLRFDVSFFSGEDVIFILEYILYISSICMINGTYYNYINRGLSQKKVSYVYFKSIISKMNSIWTSLENKYNINIDLHKLQTIEYYIYRLDLLDLNIMNLYVIMRDISSCEYFNMFISCGKYTNWGVYGKLVKFLFKYKLYFCITLIVWLKKRIL